MPGIPMPRHLREHPQSTIALPNGISHAQVDHVLRALGLTPYQVETLTIDYSDAAPWITVEIKTADCAVTRVYRADARPINIAQLDPIEGDDDE